GLLTTVRSLTVNFVAVARTFEPCGRLAVKYAVVVVGVARSTHTSSPPRIAFASLYDRRVVAHAAAIPACANSVSDVRTREISPVSGERMLPAGLLGVQRGHQLVGVRVDDLRGLHD